MSTHIVRGNINRILWLGQCPARKGLNPKSLSPSTAQHKVGAKIIWNNPDITFRNYSIERF